VDTIVASVAVGRTPLCAALAFAVFASAKWHLPAKFPVSLNRPGKESIEMAMTDPIADMLTRVRNATSAKLPVVDIPASNLKREIARVLQEKGFIKKFVVVEDGKQGILKILLRYTDGAPAIQGIQRVSRPGLRHYVDSAKLPRVRNGLGFAIISTSQGVMTDHEARKQNVGGEVLAKVW